MINAMTQAISAVLKAEFGCEVYMEKQEQGFGKPCFFIACNNAARDQFLGKRYFSQNQFCIQYFPASEEGQQESGMAAEKLTWCMEYITINGEQFRGTKMKQELIDGILYFYVNYDYFVYRQQETYPAMESMKAGMNVKKGEQS